MIFFVMWWDAEYNGDRPGGVKYWTEKPSLWPEDVKFDSSYVHNICNLAGLQKCLAAMLTWKAGNLVRLLFYHLHERLS